MRVILKNFGFSYKKIIDSWKFRTERNNMIAFHMEFLRKMHSVRNKSLPMPVTYLDESWVNANHSSECIWQSSTNHSSLKAPLKKGSRMIICHYGSADQGFIPSVKLVFQSKGTADYHEEMNSEVFKI